LKRTGGDLGIWGMGEFEVGTRVREGRSHEKGVWGRKRTEERGCERKTTLEVSTRQWDGEQGECGWREHKTSPMDNTAGKSGQAADLPRTAAQQQAQRAAEPTPETPGTDWSYHSTLSWPDTKIPRHPTLATDATPGQHDLSSAPQSGPGTPQIHKSGPAPTASQAGTTLKAC